jgi:hypothetical protein
MHTTLEQTSRFSWKRNYHRGHLYTLVPTAPKLVEKLPKKGSAAPWGAEGVPRVGTTPQTTQNRSKIMRNTWDNRAPSICIQKFTADAAGRVGKHIFLRPCLPEIGQTLNKHTVTGIVSICLKCDRLQGSKIICALPCAHETNRFSRNLWM